VDLQRLKASGFGSIDIHFQTVANVQNRIGRQT